MEDLQKLSLVIFEEWLICDRESFWVQIFCYHYVCQSLISVTFSCINHCERPHSAESHCLCQVNMNLSFNIEIDELNSLSFM